MGIGALFDARPGMAAQDHDGNQTALNMAYL
jgi:hypothetical protein